MIRNRRRRKTPSPSLEAFGRLVLRKVSSCPHLLRESSLSHSTTTLSGSTCSSFGSTKELGQKGCLKLFHNEEQKGAEPQKKKSVSFSTVTIREHARILSDNPSCPDGLSLGIDWKHTNCKVYSVNIHENQQLGRRIGACGNSLKKLDSLQRKVLLRHIGGYSERQLRQAYKNNSVVASMA